MIIMKILKKDVLSFSGNQQIMGQGIFLIVEGYLIQESNGTFIQFLKQGSIFQMDKGDNWFQYFSRGKCFLLEVESDKYTEEMIYDTTERLIQALRCYRLSGKERIESLLYQIGMDIGIKNNQDIYIPVPCSQSELARYSNVSREYFVKMKNDLVENERIELRKRNWVLLQSEEWRKEEALKRN